MVGLQGIEIKRDLLEPMFKLNYNVKKILRLSLGFFHIQENERLKLLLIFGLDLFFCQIEASSNCLMGAWVESLSHENHILPLMAFDSLVFEDLI